MAQVHNKMLGDISVDKIKESPHKRFLTPQDSLGGSKKAIDIEVADIDGIFHSTNKNVENILKELFMYANDGKGLVASAIVGKGVAADGSETFASLATKIGLIAQGMVTTVQTTKLNVTAPQTKTITLTSQTPISKLCTMVLEYIQDTGLVKYNCDFNNSDEANFVPSDKVVYDGTMKLKNSYLYGATTTADGITESGYIYINDFANITSLSLSDSTALVSAAPLPQLIMAKSDINLSGIESLDSIEWTATTSENGKVLLLISFDSILSWKAYDGSNWVTVDTSNLADVQAKGMTKAMVDSLDKTILESARGTSTRIRFAYYISQDSATDVAQNDKITIKVSMPGYSKICDKSKYDITFDQATNTVSYVFNTNGTYTINYND